MVQTLPLWRPSLLSSSSSSSSTSSDFCLTPSREPMFWLLHDLLALRQAKREAAMQGDAARLALLAAYKQVEQEAKHSDSMRCPNIRDIEGVMTKRRRCKAKRLRWRNPP